jgi:hypothetical protein
MNTSKTKQPSNDLQIVGTITARLIGPDGKTKLVRNVKNIVTNAGRQLIIDRLQAASAAVADYMAIGTGTTAAAAGDTTLVTEVARAQGTLSQPDAHTDRLVQTFAAGTGTGSITEVGRLNNTTGGVLMGRSVFTAIPKGADDSLQMTYDFTYAAG